MRKAIIFLLTATIGTTSLVYSMSSNSMNMHEKLIKNNYRISTYIVGQGDNLWNIAKEFKDSDTEIRYYIDAVKELNGIDSNIRPGQEIQILVRGE